MMINVRLVILSVLKYQQNYSKNLGVVRVSITYARRGEDSRQKLGVSYVDLGSLCLLVWLG